MYRVRAALAMPLLLGYLLTNRRALIDLDVERWQNIKGRRECSWMGLLRCLSEDTHEFRNLYYHRLTHGNVAGMLAGKLLRGIYTPEKTLFLATREIGPGLFIQHGFATIVSGSVGPNCWINQQVTIGYRAVRAGEPLVAPTILEGATICAGAKVLGDVTVGRYATVGANAVVVKDVPDGMVAVGVPAVNRPAGMHGRSNS